MGLINESQRDKAQVQPTQGKLPKVNAAQVEKEVPVVDGVQQPVEFSAESANVQPQPQPTEGLSNAVPTEANLPVPANIGLSEDTLQEQFANTSDTPLSNQQFRSELNPNPRTSELSPLEQTIGSPFGTQEPPELPGLSTPPVNQPITVPELTSLYSPVKEQGLSPYAPQVVNSQLPTIYETTPSSNALSAANRLFAQEVNRYTAEQQQTEVDNLSKVKFAQQALDTLANTPDVDKPWRSSFTGFLSDVFFGSEQARKRTEQGNFSPLAGEFGRQGAGVGGFLKYALNSTINIPLAIYGEKRKQDYQAIEDLRKAGVNIARYSPDRDPLVGFNVDAANQQGNLIGRALTGDDVGDTNDPKASTSTNTGRVFYSPRRQEGQKFYEDPLGLAIEVGVNLFNPVDEANLVGRAIGEGVGFAAKKAGQVIFRRNAPKITGLSSAQSATQEVTQAVVKETPEIAPVYRSIPSAPAAANPVKITRVENGSATVSQRLVPPVFDPSLVPPANLKPVLPVPKSNPASVVLEVGIGSPGLRLSELGSLELRPYKTIVNQLQTSKPQLLETYTGKTWEELKDHLAQFSDVDVSELGVVGSKLTDEANVLTKDDLATAAEELAAYKQLTEVPLQRLDDYFGETVDFGRKADEGLGLRRYTLDEVDDILSNGGLPNFHPKALDSLPEAFSKLLRAGDYERFTEALGRAGENVGETLAKLTDAHNLILSTPVPVNAVKPTKALTQLPSDLYHGTALADFNPSYNLSIFGSRGELGSGLYLTNSKQIASDYALARVSENVNPQTLDLDLSPGVYQLQSTLERTLDARASIPSNDVFFRELSVGLPEELQAPLKQALSKGKTTTYNGYLTKLEASLPKANLQPSEDTLQSLQTTVSNNLRRLGYDSVYDSKSGFALVLDETKVSSTSVQKLPSPTADLAAIARYNADAYASKYYPNRLTTDANLRDSTTKVLNQLRARVDEKLGEVQQQLIDRLDEVDGILPKLTEDVAQTTSKPKSAQEALQELGDDFGCG
ncbi:hypothetical protein [Nostoc cycadae]|uniref:Uncharacterized protein n=1 Tax=Nostoc cycadae WK-1 TaxID=1861711 RepID=A0A2H6LC65_9NOSO|nr:hypothetical protein [Nostoc cycadae]GBE90837.1 hypothetical protein NCWK1_0557 [Nostoc cycadae WK-1]